jgi:hypothetical protein
VISISEVAGGEVVGRPRFAKKHSLLRCLLCAYVGPGLSKFEQSKAHI